MQQKYCDHGRSVARVDDHAADVAGAQLLRLGRKAEESVDLALGEQLHGVASRRLMTQLMSFSGSSPTYAAMIAR